MNQNLCDRIKALGEYTHVRQLEDGTIIGVGELMFTRAIYWDLDLCGFARRFCYKDRDLALAEYEKAQSGDVLPTGWIATRPEPPNFYEKEPPP